MNGAEPGRRRAGSSPDELRLRPGRWAACSCFGHGLLSLLDGMCGLQKCFILLYSYICRDIHITNRKKSGLPQVAEHLLAPLPASPGESRRWAQHQEDVLVPDGIVDADLLLPRTSGPACAAREMLGQAGLLQPQGLNDLATDSAAGLVAERWLDRYASGRGVQRPEEAA